MQKRLTISVSFILAFSIITLMFIFNDTVPGSTDDIFAAYQCVNQMSQKPVLVTDVAEALAEYDRSVGGVSVEFGTITTEVVPSLPAGAESVTASSANPNFFYHQSRDDGCGHHGSWSESRKWGYNSPSDVFNENGCAVYSLASAFSHITQSRVTPEDVLNTLGVTWTGEYYNVATAKDASGDNHFSTGSVNIYRSRALSTLTTNYGGYYEEVTNPSEMLKALTSGAVVWCRVQSTTETKSVWSNNGHFVTVYGCDSKGYVAYNSSSTNFMNQHQDVDEFWHKLKDKQAFAVYP